MSDDPKSTLISEMNHTTEKFETRVITVAQLISNEMRDMNDKRLSFKINGVLANRKKLEVDDTLTAEAKRLAASCEPPHHADNYRVSFEKVWYTPPIYVPTCDLIEKGKIEEALKMANSNRTLVRCLEAIVPTQDKVGCAIDDCQNKLGPKGNDILLVCLFGPNHRHKTNAHETRDLRSNWSRTMI
uniref:Uncharacterized protein n=2 Tax=Caenorhabditis japonica TaxID=281687 RepID=A0A8R1HIC9_CAEJA